MRDASLDSDIVYHEYGHGLTWRMIGGMSGAMSGAVGEGAADGLAMLMNDNDRVVEYSTNNSYGLRSHPYDGYPRTYEHMAGTNAHHDGEIYAAIAWRMIELFEEAGARDTLFRYYVDGMNFTPASPAFEDMRDGLLASSTTQEHDCLIWRAFSEFGVGQGADGVARSRGVTVTPSTTIPAGVCAS
jgi:hypothetical protein